MPVLLKDFTPDKIEYVFYEILDYKKQDLDCGLTIITYTRRYNEQCRQEIRERLFGIGRFFLPIIEFALYFFGPRQLYFDTKTGIFLSEDKDNAMSTAFKLSLTMWKAFKFKEALALYQTAYYFTWTKKKDPKCVNHSEIIELAIEGEEKLKNRIYDEAYELFLQAYQKAKGRTMTQELVARMDLCQRLRCT